MIAHIRDCAARLPDLAQIEWSDLDTQALHTAVSAIIRMHSALGRNVDPEQLSADEALLQRQLVALQGCVFVQELHAAGACPLSRQCPCPHVPTLECITWTCSASAVSPASMEVNISTV